MLRALCALRKGFPSVKKFSLIIYITIIAFSLIGCSTRKETVFTGRTMGTTYRIKVVVGFFKSTDGLQAKIDKRLTDINQSMSTYLPESEISRFNRFIKAGERFAVSEDFIRVMQVAEQIHAISDGAWDGTIGPVVDLWGFGAKGRKTEVPNAQTIRLQLEKVGFQRIKRVEDQYLIKTHASVGLDFASIAKGYGVDQVAEVIRSAGIDDFLVEIGGEVFASGKKADGQLWRIGINTPRKDAAIDQVYRAAPLENRALATSGDYRNFFEIDGVRYSHVIDPRNGYPVTNGVVSVSITADTCTFADGLATAIMVMGPKEGLALINRLDRVEGLIIVSKKDTLQEYLSNNF